MPVPQPFYVGFNRIAVTVVLTAILVWICVAAAISVGYSVFWERERRQQIPAETIVSIENQEAALRCAKGLRFFHNELLFNVRRFIKTYVARPQHAKDIWDRWLLEWQSDYREFGRRYQFHLPVAELSANQREFLAIYRQLGELAESYGSHFEELAHLHTSNRENIRPLIQDIESRWRAASP